MIDHFTTQQFEDALPVNKKTGLPMWEYIGFFGNERVYQIQVTADCFIRIRSSIDSSGVAKDSGDDSIRVYLMSYVGGSIVGKGILPEYITRVPGWEKRLSKKIRELWVLKSKIGQCPVCGQSLHLRKSKENKLYRVCPANTKEKKHHFSWFK